MPDIAANSHHTKRSIAPWLTLAGILMLTAIALRFEGQNWWCACGESRNQPFCDGSHKTTPFTPVKFTAEKSGKVWLCGCKQSGTKPYCDGTHKSL